MRVHLDLLGGLAGDMFIAAVLDAFPEHTPGLLQAIRAAAVTVPTTCRLVPHSDGVLQGSRFEVALSASDHEVDWQQVVADHQAAHASTSPHGHAHAHDHDDDHQHHHPDERHDVAARHRHIAWRTLRQRLQAAPLAPAVTARAIGIFALLAEAEAQVHGVSIDDVQFHEVGAWDSVADIVGAAYLTVALQGADERSNDVRVQWSTSAVPLGGGRVQTDHGPMPVPAPATAWLLRGYTLNDDGIQGERVTPTGAAILRYLAPPQPDAAPPSSQRLLRTGTGFGTRRLHGISNCVRVLVFDAVAAPSAAAHRRLAVIEFEVDDQTPESLAHGLDRLRARDGVIDVLQATVLGKKGRIGAAVRILAAPDVLAGTIDACFRETTTIGLRHHLVDGVTLPRTMLRVPVGDGMDVRVKATERPGGRTAKAEADDLQARGDQAERALVAAHAEAEALRTAEREHAAVPVGAAT